jgi:hypothetical protein
MMLQHTLSEYHKLHTQKVAAVFTTYIWYIYLVYRVVYELFILHALPHVCQQFGI